MLTPLLRRALLATTLSIVLSAPDALAQKKTVCAITINSADEKEVFRRSLPEAEFDFVELVEKGHPDWLESACSKRVRCDVLLISGHFDDGTEFYSGRPDAPESLPVEEMERASCSSCELFSQLKEVYLFGCNTLDPRPLKSASPEIARSLVRSGYSQADAERLSSQLAQVHAESNRDHMRQVFKDVPVIYGFSSKAPLGPAAGAMLSRYFQSASGNEIGTGEASGRLLKLFAPSSMTVAAGLRDSDAQADYRRDVCHFADDRLSPAEKAAFVHQLLHREAAEARMFLGYIEKYIASLNDEARRTEDVSQALSAIAADQPAREKFLTFARDADDPAVRARMIAVARNLGWLSVSEQRAEWMAMIGEQLAQNAIRSADVDLACTLNRDGSLGAYRDLRVSTASNGAVPQAAMLACLGNETAQARIVHALSSPRDEDVQMAQVYLRHRPLAGTQELRDLTLAVAHMPGSDAQVRALNTLAGYPLSDRKSMEELLSLFSATKMIEVQRAVAGILIRADLSAMAGVELLKRIRQSRLKSADGEDMIDVLIRRLQRP